VGLDEEAREEEMTHADLPKYDPKKDGNYFAWILRQVERLRPPEQESPKLEYRPVRRK
jgi:hypothetical protein